MEDLNIVFLDIDGVLQPYDSQFNFYSYDKKLIDSLSNKYNVDYSKYNFSIIAAIYYDWDDQAVSRLKYILDQTNSKIITSSDWRELSPSYNMEDLFKIHLLDKYYFADNIILPKEPTESLDLIRAKEIKASLEKYNIDNYVVLDDMKNMIKHFPNNTVITNNIISINNMNEAIKILKK